MSKTTVSTNNSVGSAILALSGMLSRTYSKNPSGKSIKCRIALEKAGVIRSIEDRVKSGLALTPQAYKDFKALAKGKGPDADGATRVLELADNLAARGKAIEEYKAAGGKPAAKKAPAKKAAKKVAKAAPAGKKPFRRFAKKAAK